MRRVEKACLALASLLGAGLAANGIYILASPAAWHFAVPGVTTTGPFNQHFLRDIGLIFILIGVAVFLGVARPATRVTLWGAGRCGSPGTRCSTSGRSPSVSAVHRRSPAISRR